MAKRVPAKVPSTPDAVRSSTATSRKAVRNGRRPSADAPPSTPVVAPAPTVPPSSISVAEPSKEAGVAHGDALQTTPDAIVIAASVEPALTQSRAVEEAKPPLPSAPLAMAEPQVELTREVPNDLTETPVRVTVDVGETATNPVAHTDARTDDTVFDVARELLASDYYRQQWGRAALRSRSEKVDDFGLDRAYAARWQVLFDLLYERWWRVETRNIEHVPASGRAILCANHSGALPYDGVMLATAIRREHPARRELRWLADDFIFHFPFLGTIMNRIGAVRACQENASRLLSNEACVGVFPEGVKGISKLYRDKYRLQRFGRGGHVKLAIRTQTPIVPVAIMGAEETHPMIASSGWLARLFGLPFLPITPTFPWLGVLGMIPVPAKWRISFLEPVSVSGYATSDADDDVLVGRINEKIRVSIQEELDRMTSERQSIIRG